jgi:hypothetical protein
MEKYIITFEDGQHFVADEINESTMDGLYDGILTIIRTSDCKELSIDGVTWDDLKQWG